MMLSTLQARFSRVRPSFRVAGTALLVAASYYAGANLGIILRFPPSVPSVVWPPNSILTATLLLTPPKRWWIYLLAALPAHLAAELPAWPAPLVLALFVTNCSEALIAAICVRRFSDAPQRLDTLRRVGAFIAGAVLIAPFLSSFLDAAAVASLGGQPYWSVWRTRFASNVLTELMVAPAILTVACARRESAWPSSARRRAEAAALTVLLLGVAIAVFAAGTGELPAITGTSRSPLAWLLPFLLWAAVRFGPLGASVSLLSTMLVAIWAATHSLGAFSRLPVADHVPSLQIFLSVVAIPLLCLAALIEERRQVQKALADRLRFEEFLARVSTAFVHVPSRQIDDAIRDSLRHLGEFLQLDRVMLLRFSPDSRRLGLTQSWAAPGIDREPGVIVGRDSPAAAERLLRNEPFVFSRPPERDVASVAGASVRSSITVPLIGNRGARGALELDSIGTDRSWPEEWVQRLRLVAEVFANVLSRQEAEDALRASEAMKSAILSSLSSGVAVLDREGRVIAVNDSWSRLRTDPRTTPYGGAAIGADYFDLCREALAAGCPYAAEVLQGTKEVLDGVRDGFALEYSTRDARADRWFALSVVPLNRPEGGAVVSHTEVTERKRAEAQAQRSRQDLAHFARVAATGELTASLAHELRQPLTGILTNAQAARRLLRATPPDFGELRRTLDDIIADDRRAAETIRRIRDLVRKDDLLPSRLDLNDVIGGVTRLLASDAIIRSIALNVELAPAPVVVSGDRVQLEQVILNLLINAMDAMAEVPEARRTVVVRTGSADSQAYVAVEDAGVGIRDEIRQRLFEPFYTTKPAGMGMGLSIARSIVEAHGGTIWATNNVAQGATFHFTLPKVDERPA